MAFTIYDASVPVMIRALGNLEKILDKAVAQAKTEDRPLSDLLEARLAPDMHALPQQIQLASDAAKGAIARLAGIVPPAMPDTETTFPELHQRSPRPSTSSRPSRRRNLPAPRIARS
ncbi:MAG: DUF1993 family protein [Rhizomicrobium sp.]